MRSFYADCFSSKTQTKLLLALYTLSSPVHLRLLAALIDVPVFSVQHALKNLVKLGIILRRKNGVRVVFSLARSDRRLSPLLPVLREMQHQYLLNQAEHAQAQAPAALRFADQAHKLIPRLP
jgi:hypothetical protein